MWKVTKLRHHDVGDFNILVERNLDYGRFDAFLVEAPDRGTNWPPIMLKLDDVKESVFYSAYHTLQNRILRELNNQKWLYYERCGKYIADF